ncbi:hypothetical protein BJV74DRAFT_376936 [Russula compacta]|nr:hypothetical protein BJV74DRAFT_376936 [Russula compacta]
MAPPSPSLSPPTVQSPSSSNTPPSDESAMYELSFDYEQNSAGEWKRVSKGRSSPPTPVDKQSPPSTDIFPPKSGDPSPLPATRLSLTRSESLPGIPSTLPTERSDPVPSAQSALRSFQRALSGPLSLPQSSSQLSHTPGQLSSTHVRTILAGGLRSSGRTTGGPRRVTLEEYNQINEKLKIQQQQEQEQIGLHLQATGLPQDEKENHDGSSLPPIETTSGPSSIHRRYSPPRSAPGLSDAHYSYLPSRYSAVGATSSNVRSTLADVVPVPQRPSLPMSSTASSTRQLVLDRAVSVAYTRTDRKSSHRASLSTRSLRSMVQMMAYTPIQLLARKLMEVLRSSRICGPRCRLRVNASMRSRILLLGPGDLQVSVTRLRQSVPQRHL